MSTTDSTKNNNKKITPNYTLKQALVNYYLFVMFTLFPFFFSNKYSNIRHDKFYFFIISTGLLLVAELMLIMTSKLDSNTGQIGENTGFSLMKNWCNGLSFTDYTMLAFLLVCVISTLLSDNPITAFYGEPNGRNNGLLLMIFYVAVYFLITRLFCYFEYLFVAFACGSAAVFVLTILNGFYIDPLGMSEGLTGKDVLNFMSTIGNKNMLSSFICIALPVSIAMSVHTQKNALRALYLAVSGLGFAALMVADSDSGIVGISVFLIIYFLWYVRRIDRLKRYFLVITVMLFAAKLLRLFSLLMNDNYKEMYTYQQLFVFSNKSYILLVVAGIITVLLYLLDFKKPATVLPKAVPVFLVCIFAVAVVGAVAAVVYFSFIDTNTDLGRLEMILRFNDKWGTHRGFMWIRSMWIFNDYSIFEKLFGCGPDTFYYAFQPYFNDLLNFGDGSTTAAHNEYINYLVTIGIAGLGTYLAVVGGAIARAVKSAKQNPIAIVCASAVICYSVQAFVNIAQPITTPLFVIFIALCEAAAIKN